MVHRSAAFAQIQHGGQRAGNVCFGILYGLMQRLTFGQIGSNGRGQRAAGAVGIGVVDALSMEPVCLPVFPQQIIRIIDGMAAFA